MRAPRRTATPGYGLETELAEPVAALIEAAAAAAQALDALLRPLVTLGRRLEAVLAEGARLARRPGARAGRGRGRFARLARRDGRRVDRRCSRGSAARPIPISSTGWRSTGSRGANIDIGLHRHWLDPTRPLAETVLKPAHGVLVTSATLRGGDPDWEVADARAGVPHLDRAAGAFRRRQPVRLCDAGRSADRHRRQARRPGRARQRLCPADRGGGRRDAGAVHRDPAAARRPCPDRRPARARRAAALRAACRSDRHRHAWSTSSATIRAPRCSAPMRCATASTCRAKSLRLVVMEGVPWAKPTVLHAARRLAGGGSAYDDRLVRARLAQAFGRLIRRADDQRRVRAAVRGDAQPPARRLPARRADRARAARRSGGARRNRDFPPVARAVACKSARLDQLCTNGEGAHEDPDPAPTRQIGLGRSWRARFRPAPQPQGRARRADDGPAHARARPELGPCHRQPRGARGRDAGAGVRRLWPRDRTRVGPPRLSRLGGDAARLDPRRSRAMPNALLLSGTIPGSRNWSCCSSPTARATRCATTSRPNSRPRASR